MPGPWRLSIADPLLCDGFLSGLTTRLGNNERSVSFEGPFVQLRSVYGNRIIRCVRGPSLLTHLPAGRGENRT